MTFKQGVIPILILNEYSHSTSGFVCVFISKSMSRWHYGMAPDVIRIRLVKRTLYTIRGLTSITTCAVLDVKRDREDNLTWAWMRSDVLYPTKAMNVAVWWRWSSIRQKKPITHQHLHDLKTKLNNNGRTCDINLDSTVTITVKFHFIWNASKLTSSAKLKWYFLFSYIDLQYGAEWRSDRSGMARQIHALEDANDYTFYFEKKIITF